MRPTPNMIDLLLGAEMALGKELGLKDEEAWAPEYKRIYSQTAERYDEAFFASKDKVRLSFALGIKATDGVIALKARDVAGLNDCAVQIEKLAELLEVPDRCVQRANRVKQQANQRQWIAAFAELGRLQHEVVQYLDGEDEETRGPSRKDDALLIVMGGWLQGGRSFSRLILDHYTDKSSNILREPKLVEILNDEVKAMKPDYLKKPLVQEMLKFMPEVHKRVDVDLYDPVPKPDVEWLHENFSKIIESVRTLEKTEK